MKTDKEVYRTAEGLLYELGLDRILKYIQNGFVLLSAAQGRDEETEKKAFSELKRQIHEIGAGFMELDGVWMDEKASEEFREKSLFIPYPGEKWGTLEDFITKMLEFAKYHNQKGIIRGDEKKIELLYLTGDTIDLGDFQSDKLSSAYFEISKEKHPGRAFVFKGVRIPRGAFDAFVMKVEGYILEGTFFFELK